MSAFDAGRTLAHRHQDLEWRLIYVSSPGNEELDQELDDCLVGPVPVGVNAFDFEGSAPNPSKIPTEDVLGVAALILTGSYKDQEFVRVGYYQNTEYDNEEMKEALPEPIRFDRLVRDINSKPRVTRFQIKWCVFPTATIPHNFFGHFAPRTVFEVGLLTRACCRDISPQQQTGQAIGAATSAAVPSANDLDAEDEPSSKVKIEDIKMELS